MMAYENNNLNNAPFMDGSNSSGAGGPFEQSFIEGKLDTTRSSSNASNRPMGFFNQQNNISQLQIQPQQQQHQQQQMNNFTDLQMQKQMQMQRQVQMQMQMHMNIDQSGNNFARNNSNNNFSMMNNNNEMMNNNNNNNNAMMMMKNSMMNSNNNNMMRSNPMAMNNAFPQPTLMSSMAMGQPFFQQQQQQHQAQPSCGIPSFITFNNNNNNCTNTNGSNCRLPQQNLLGGSFEPTPNSSISLPSFLDAPSIHHNSKPSFLGNCNVVQALPMSTTKKTNKTSSSSSSEPIKATTTATTTKPTTTAPSAFASSSSLPPLGGSAPRGSICKSKRLLPPDFQPNEHYVICGNKRKYFESPGNVRFREVCKTFLSEYVAAPTKIEKSAVVSKVMNILRKDCNPKVGQPFVSPQTKDGMQRWYAVSERTAREKVGTYFRDCLSDNYKSSAKNKIARRKIIKKCNAAAAAASASGNSSAATSCANNGDDFSDDDDDDHDDNDSLESISFYDVDDLTPVPLQKF